MAKSFVSPGVFTNEVDASFLGPGVGAIGAALIGTAAKGPAFVPVTVENMSQFVQFFGDLDTDHLLTYGARAYLRNAATANIMRVLGPDGRTVNGAAVTPGYSAESLWTVNATLSASQDAAVMAMLEITASHDVVVTDLTSNELYIDITDGSNSLVATTCSFLTSSGNYIKKVLNTDPTVYDEKGYYVMEVYDYAYGKTTNGDAVYGSSSFGGMTNFQRGYNSGSTPWIKSQVFGGASEYNLFRFHTLGHGDAENGRFKISVNNVRPSVAPSISEFGKFDIEVRLFNDTDRSKSIVESFTNVSLDPVDNNYVLRVIGDKFWMFDSTRTKMVEYGDFANRSNLIRIEMVTASFPDAALPWGFKGLEKPWLGILSGTGGVDFGLESDVDGLSELPLVADLKDKETQSEAGDSIYWGMETVLSGNVKSRLAWLPKMTGSDSDFSLKNVAGTALAFLSYSADLALSEQKSPGDSTSNNVLQSSHAKFTVPVAFGFDGFDRKLSDPLEDETQLLAVTQIGTQALRQAVDIVGDPDFIDINMICIPGIFASTVVDYTMNMVADRADTFYVADISGSNVDSVVQEVKGRGFDNNYTGIYYPAIKVWDDVNKTAKQVPASVPAIGAIAYNDRVAYPWFAPAGLNRAGLGPDVIGFDVLSVTDQLTQDERNDLYENRINPIARFPDVPQGVIWGQKTLQLKASALDRINVRRLMIRAKKLIASAVKFLVFEPANATTMTRFRQLVNPILADIQQKQGLEKFKVIMDETTSPPELIDRNRLHGKIYLIPTRSAEFISIDFIISPSGASFDE